jgi:hypothetical protein
MKLIFIVIGLIAFFHLSLYYCNVDLFSRFKKDTNSVSMSESATESVDLTATTADLEKQLNELKQYDTQQVHG